MTEQTETECEHHTSATDSENHSESNSEIHWKMPALSLSK